MGRPGGFFKKLKAKQKKAASRTQRGTKGASKEDRRRKHNERVEVYAAKREAEQLAVVSSSSDEEPSTDSEAEVQRETKSLRRLRAMLGAGPKASAASRSSSARAAALRSRGNASGLQKRRRQAKGSDDESRSSHSAGDDNDNADDRQDGWDSSDSEAVAEELKARRPPHRRPRRDPSASTVSSKKKKSSAAANGSDDSEGELDGEDWRLYLGQSSSGSGSGSDEEKDEVDSDAELGEETDDADDVVDKDLLMDLDDDEEEDGEREDDDDDDEEEDEEGDDEDEGSDDGANPLFGLDDDDDAAADGAEKNVDGGDDDDDDGADLFNTMMMYDDEDGEGHDEDDEEEDEEDEDEKEEAFVEEDDDASSGGSDDDGDTEIGKHTNGAADAAATADSAYEQRQLLQTFQFNTSSISVLQQHGQGVLSEKDEWVRKYHLDQHGLVDETPLKPVAVPHVATELLAESNEPLKHRAAEMLATTPDKKQLGIFFVSAEEYATMHPDNVAVLATTHAQQHLLHAPFDVSGEAWATACPSYLHPTLWQRWTAFRASKALPLFTAEERGLLDLLQGYPDVFDTLHCWQNSESRREIHALHVLNHWFKARSVVVAHDALLAKHKQARRARRRQQWALRKQQQQQQEEEEEKAKGAEDDSPAKKGKKQKKAGMPAKTPERAAAAAKDDAADEADGDEEELELRDRGFSKTRICVMCPLRNHAYKFVHTLVSILQADPEKCPKLAMFEQDFTEIEEAVDPTFRRRPRDYQRAFEGNIDDSFCVGLRLELDRVHVYAHPLNSDLLICSPLGLRRRMEKNGDVLVSLSSIEVCLVEEAQMLYQQNWLHVTAVMEVLNKRPTDTTHGLSDLRRVYSWALEGKSGRHRQTIITSEVSNATMLSTFRTASVNNSGKVVLQRRADPGVLARVLVPVRQHFVRFEPTSLATVDDDRFEFFTKQMYETKINAMAERDVRIIIFVPSYFDFVRVRNYLHRDYRESYAAISEYTSLKQQRKALGQFSDLERPVLLVTERFYFFKRYFVKMAEALVFYSPPMFPEYYASLTNRLVATSPNAFTMTLYCRYDTHELNRLVGTSRMVQLLERESGVFSFVTS